MDILTSTKGKAGHFCKIKEMKIHSIEYPISSNYYSTHVKLYLRNKWLRRSNDNNNLAIGIECLFCATFTRKQIFCRLNIFLTSVKIRKLKDNWISSTIALKLWIIIMLLKQVLAISFHFLMSVLNYSQRNTN